MAQELKTYVVAATLALEISIEVEAESLRGAAEFAETLKEADFVKILGEYNDGDIRIISVYELK